MMKGLLKHGISLGKLAGKAGAKAIGATAKGIAEHRAELASVGTAAVKAAGTTAALAGQGVKTAATQGARALSAAGADSESKLVKAGARAAAVALRGVGAGASAVQFLGDKAGVAAPAVGQAAAGAIGGVAGTASNAVDAFMIRERDLAVLQQRLRVAGQRMQRQSRFRQEAIASAAQRRRKPELLDLLAIGGITLGAMVRDPSLVPAEVERAFALAYPGLAAKGLDFVDAVQHKSSGELLGLVNGVKGKLFELDLVDHLNDGGLPAGLTASLAPSATQPGHDVLVTDGHGAVVDLLQAKATDSVSYVKAALERYPDIDVMTTTEVHARLLALGVGDRVTDSGISEVLLQHKIEAAAGLAAPDGVVDWLPGGASVALIALSALVDRSVSLEQRGAQAGERMAAVGVTGVAGKATLMATGYWWLGLAAGLGSKFLADHGGHKRQRLDALQRAVEIAERQARPARRGPPVRLPRG